MKKTILLLTTALCATWVSAQITITNATFPAEGDTLKMAFDAAPPTIEITPPGGDQNWDFSDLKLSFDRTLIYRPASEGSVGDQVPNADLFADLGGDTEGYYRVTATAVEWVAVNGPDPIGFGISTVFKFNPPIIERRAPMNFFDINQISSALLLPFSSDIIPDTLLSTLPLVPDSIRLRVSLQRLDVVDAWGKLTIPGGSYSVLREKRTEYRETRIDVLAPFIGWFDVTDLLLSNPNFSNLGVDTVLTYNFFNDQEKEPIAVVTMDAQQANATQVMFKNNGVLINSAGDLATEKPSVSAVPNPVVSQVDFDLSNWQTGNYDLKIFAPGGVEVWSQKLQLSGFQQVQADLSGFPAGVYFYQLFDESGKAAARGRLVKI